MTYKRDDVSCSFCFQWEWEHWVLSCINNHYSRKTHIKDEDEISICWQKIPLFCRRASQESGDDRKRASEQKWIMKQCQIHKILHIVLILSLSLSLSLSLTQSCIFYHSSAAFIKLFLFSTLRNPQSFPRPCVIHDLMIKP